MSKIIIKIIKIIGFLLSPAILMIIISLLLYIGLCIAYDKLIARNLTSLL
jgi:hypothetical protein